MNELTEKLAKAFESDIRGRKGFRYVWDDMDDDIIEEVRLEWRALILYILSKEQEDA
jgi:hypothetical protein